jgi:hypothetical protein
MNAILNRFLLVIAVVLFVSISSLAVADGTQQKAGQKITVYKSPTCGCCQGWIDYLQDNGFIVEAHDTNELNSIKQDNGLTNPRLASCHTALVDGYVVEGHVPVEDIRRLISERPSVIGITAPGMPQMSPGMQSLEPKGYNVYTFNSGGQITIYSRY